MQSSGCVPGQVIAKPCVPFGRVVDSEVAHPTQWTARIAAIASEFLRMRASFFCNFHRSAKGELLVHARPACDWSLVHAHSPKNFSGGPDRCREVCHISRLMQGCLPRAAGMVAFADADVTRRLPLTLDSISTTSMVSVGRPTKIDAANGLRSRCLTAVTPHY